MNLLGIVQAVCVRSGITQPTAVMSSGDDTYLQMAALLDEVITDLKTRNGWNNFTEEVVFSSVAAESQGLMGTLAPGFQRMVNETIFDRTRRLPIFGPTVNKDWQALKTFNFTGPLYRYRIRGNELLITPTMPIGHTLAFEYITAYGVYDNTLLAYKGNVSDDQDTFRYPDELLIAGLRWRWKAEKGLPYFEEQRLYENLVSSSVANDGSHSTISLDDTSPEFRPGIFVPQGDWTV